MKTSHPQRKIRSLFPLAILLGLLLAPAVARASAGAEIPWTTYEAEAMATTGTVLGPKYDPFLVETESSGQQCVKMNAAGQYVEFAARARANTLVVRYSLPDSATGGGINSTLRLTINGQQVQSLPLTSHYSWNYGQYPFTKDPHAGKPRNFYNDARVTGLTIHKGDRIRLEKPYADGAYCILDLVDLEDAPAPLKAPDGSISVKDFGACGTGETDDTTALRDCLAQAGAQKKIVWVPPGTYKLAGDILLPSGAVIQGAGMWHTTFIGDPDLYRQPDKRVRFKLAGQDIRLTDFAIIGKLNYRNDDEPNDGILGGGCQHCLIARVWVEHTKTGMWFYNGSQVRVLDCRLRNTMADGINLCVGCRECTIENCTTRGTGDDCFAIWPVPSDQGYTEQTAHPGANVIRHCTGQLPFLANGGAIYGGRDNHIEDCRFVDISPGCGILISSTFPTWDEKLKIDNNFSGTTVIRHCELLRCGGYDHDWAWRAALQLCADRHNISGVELQDVHIQDSLSDGLSVVAPGSPHGTGTFSNIILDQVNIGAYGLGTATRHGLWIRNDADGSLEIRQSQIKETKNDAAKFQINQE
jgi:hypothetical protein